MTRSTVSVFLLSVVKPILTDPGQLVAAGRSKNPAKNRRDEIFQEG